EAITPELLRVLESVAEDPVKHVERKDYMLHDFALYLLAQFREKRAYAPIVKMFSAPGETPFDLFGDTVTEGLSRIGACFRLSVPRRPRRNDTSPRNSRLHPGSTTPTSESSRLFGSTGWSRCGRYSTGWRKTWVPAAERMAGRPGEFFGTGCAG
ncbi:MAG: DUF1186 domain-containing protein, partial [Verrucomicrobia bacterium]|nr:DUF1186 domain-containing protein [Verrucomicrobiota bacterium]